MNNPFRDLYLAELTKKQKKLDVDKDNKIEASDLEKLRAEELTKNQKKIDKNKNGKLDGQDFTMLRKEEDEKKEKPLGKGGKVESKKYSWGTMKTVHHGSDFSIPLHPEHHEAIAKLKDQQEHKFKDETGRHWTAKKSGDNVHFQGANGGGTTHVPAHTMKEEAELAEEKPGLYANINAKRKRIEAGSKERMRKPGSEGAPSAKDFKDAAKTANENYDDNRRGFGKRPREDDEYHVPDPTVKKTKVKNFSVKKEETLLDRINELSKTTLGAYVKKSSRERGFSGLAAGASGSGTRDQKDAVNTMKKRQAGVIKAVDRLTKEEVESLEEANHREFASQGKMHPDMAKHMSVGSEHDYYEHGTGDKVSGKVMHKSATEVHMKQTHDSYDPKKKGTVHKFKISSKLDEETISEGEGYALHSKHTEADGTTTIVLKSPSGQMVTHKGKGSAVAVKQKYGIQAEETELDGNNNKEETTMNSFKSYMQEDLDEAAWPGTPEYKAKFGDAPTRGKVGSTTKGAKGTQTVTGTGVKHERDYEKAEKETSTPENQEKRGRGRPKGAASGARQKGSAAKSDDRYDSTGYKLHLPNKNR